MKTICCHFCNDDLQVYDEYYCFCSVCYNTYHMNVYYRLNRYYDVYKIELTPINTIKNPLRCTLDLFNKQTLIHYRPSTPKLIIDSLIDVTPKNFNQIIPKLIKLKVFS